MSTWKVRVQTLPVRKGGQGARRIVEERGELAILHPNGPVYNPVVFDLRPGPGYYRGGHYHKTKTETFYIVQGSCVVRYCDLQSGSEGRVEAGQGDLITISPGCAHRLEALEMCRVVEWSGDDTKHLDDTFLYDFS
jgi:mannose-6-phosphate isomerase-like protein (cupin superfamily)